MADAALDMLSDLEPTVANIPLPGSDSTVIRQARRVEREAKAAERRPIDLGELETYVRQVETEVEGLKRGKTPEARLTMHIESLLERTSLKKVLVVAARGWLRQLEALWIRALDTDAGKRSVAQLEHVVELAWRRPKIFIGAAVGFTFVLALVIGVSAGAEPQPAPVQQHEPVLAALDFPAALVVPDALLRDPSMDLSKAPAKVEKRRAKRRR